MSELFALGNEDLRLAGESQNILRMDLICQPEHLENS